MTIYTDKAREVADSIIAKINNLIATHNEGTSHYNYRLEASSVNPNIDTNITINCYVNDVNNQPVVGKVVTLYSNGTAQGSSTTDNNGKASFTVNMDSFGLRTYYLLNGVNIQVNIGGFRKVTDTDFHYYKGKDIVHLFVHYNDSLIATTSWQEYATLIQSNARPEDTIQFMEQYGAVILRIKSDGKLYFRSITGSQVNMGSMVAYASWKV